MCRKAFQRTDFQQDIALSLTLKTLHYSCKCGQHVPLADLEDHESLACASYSQEVSKALAATKVRPEQVQKYAFCINN